MPIQFLELAPKGMCAAFEPIPATMLAEPESSTCLDIDAGLLASLARSEACSIGFDSSALIAVAAAEPESNAVGWVLPVLAMSADLL